MINKTGIVALGVVVSTLLSVCASAFGQADSGILVTVATGLTQPVGVIPEPGNNDRLFAFGKTGLISVINIARNGRSEIYSVSPTPALDIVAHVHSQDNSGLLGMAFPPDYATSGKVYIFYTTYDSGVGAGVICRYTRDPANPERFLPESRELIFTAPIGIYHHGGCLRFGPDGYLYFSKGDEGNIGIISARNPGVLYGKLIRLDVSRDDFPLDPTRNYGIPADNPFAHQAGGLPEIWAVGLRSPWQFSFDRLTGDLWMADVGESSWEEATCILAGARSVDFGWPSYEGFVTGPFGTLGANPNLISFPAYVYPHTLQPGYNQNQVGCSIDGGYIYRGSQIPTWNGRYFWSDFCSSQIFSGLRSPTTGLLTDVAAMNPGLLAPSPDYVPAGLSNVVSFGENNEGELYVCEIFGGRIRKLVPRFAAADIGRAGGEVGPDGELDNNDFVVFIDWYFNSDARCDMGKTGGVQGADGVFDNNDFIVFIDSFFNNLP